MEELSEVMVDALGRTTWWRCQHISAVTNSSSPIPAAGQQEHASAALRKSHPSLSPSLRLSLWQKKRGSQPWFFCVLLGSREQ